MRRLIVGIVDYGIGNHTSVKTALKKLGYINILSHNTDELAKCDMLILPGVGTFSEAMAFLNHYKLTPFLQEWAMQAKPLLGICLGMQLLADKGYEGGVTKGLGLIPGEVVSLGKLKDWHIGWNGLKLNRRDKLFSIKHSTFFYFNHSHLFLAPKDSVIAEATYLQTIPSILHSGTVLGMQFHPEKSQKDGLDLLYQAIEGLCHA